MALFCKGANGIGYCIIQKDKGKNAAEESVGIKRVHYENGNHKAKYDAGKALLGSLKATLALCGGAADAPAIGPLPVSSF